MLLTLLHSFPRVFRINLMLRLPTFHKKQTGFTLIELLIVIAIIVILMGLAFVSFSTVQRNARNSQRQADLAKIAGALEEYYSDHGFYPTTNKNGHTPAQFESAGRSPAPGGHDKIICLLGDPQASLMTVQVNNWSCTQDASGKAIPGPYNVYLANGTQTKIPKDPLKEYYAYSSDGQTYVLVTQCYEGTPPTERLFTSTNSSYYNEATLWSGSINTTACGTPWSQQYFLRSPQG